MTIRPHRAFVVGVALLVVPPLADAATQRTFVSVSGTSNPNCSLAAPCRSFAEAIGATNAGGEIIVLDSGGYGPVTVTKSMSIIAPPGVYAGVSVFSGNGITVNAPGATVVLRGLSVNGQGGAIGIDLLAAARLRVENCVISNMGAQGIYHQADNAEMIVLDTIVRDNNGDVGIRMVASNASIALDHVRSEHNQNGGFYVAPIPGASFAFAAVTISDSLFAENLGNGIWADSAGSAVTEVAVERTMVMGNLGHGIEATSGAADSRIGLVVTRSTFRNNHVSAVHALGILPGQVFSHVSENSIIDNHIEVNGSGSQMWASGNTGLSGLMCTSGATLRSFGDNHVTGIGVAGCGSYSIIGAF